ncbi:thymidylate synthase [Filifactor alocis ATCC 35896]|uniref:Thymidylate synthase n=1 Tax=Filifactor alocis (strain ATCC 35896 / CCUG 47790 / D40 B5) TaxID=546269 RepID=D6GQY7_FILAD|nr:thymidylate synthase [Filifactor alocis]EFE29190.1 thymidylate synthase [Filifactor alocis ATCC 35896]
MTKADKNFKELCTRILEEGYNTKGEKVRPKYADGTPSHTYFVNQVWEEYDLQKGEFPILTLRHIAWKSSIKEILWIYQDQTNSLDVLEDKYDIHWWNDWEVEQSRTIGQRYGATVKRYDLMNKLLNGLKTQPYGRRHIINLYQYQDFQETDGLFPCAMETHWSVRDGILDMTLIQRSSDVPVANAINKLQYVALMMMVAKHCDFKLGKFCHLVQNAHIYDRHVEQVKEMLERKGQEDCTDLRLVLDTDKTDFYTFTLEDFKLENYEPNKPNFKFELAI